MGLLGDIYSGIDTQRRKLSGLLDDPWGTFQQKVAQFGEDQNGLLNLQANAYPMAGDKTVLNTPDQISQFRQQLADAGANQAMAAMTVYHGSPHKFDAFDSSKIGSGEGVQAYGHGHYFAENPEVASNYASSLAGRKGPNIDGAPVNRTRGGFAEGAMANMLSNRLAAGLTPDAAKAQTLEWASQHPQIGADAATSIAERLSPPKPNIYKVDLPDEHIAKMLDWDKPLSEQSPEIQAIAVKRIAELKAGGAYDHFFPDDPTGQWLHKAIGPQLQGEGGGMFGAEAAAQTLQQQGVPGIRYLDGGSRGAGTGTSNYVIFPKNEGILTILERNGVPVK